MARFVTIKVRYDIEELAAACIDNLSRPQNGSKTAEPREERLVESERCQVPDPVRVAVQLLATRVTQAGDA